MGRKYHTLTGSPFFSLSELECLRFLCEVTLSLAARPDGRLPALLHEVNFLCTNESKH